LGRDDLVGVDIVPQNEGFASNGLLHHYFSSQMVDSFTAISPPRDIQIQARSYRRTQIRFFDRATTTPDEANDRLSRSDLRGPRPTPSKRHKQSIPRVFHGFSWLCCSATALQSRDRGEWEYSRRELPVSAPSSRTRDPVRARCPDRAV